MIKKILISILAVFFTYANSCVYIIPASYALSGREEISTKPQEVSIEKSIETANPCCEPNKMDSEFEAKKTATLNEELRKAKKEISDLNDTVTSLNVLTTLGDTLYHDGTSNQRLAGNTSATKKFLSQTGTGSVSAATVWDVPAGVSSETLNYTAGSDFTHATTSFATVTGVSITRTITSTAVLIIANFSFEARDAVITSAFTFSVAGSDVGSTHGIATQEITTLNDTESVSLHWLATGLTPGSNTFSLRAKNIAGGGTITVLLTGGYSATITVVEL